MIIIRHMRARRLLVKVSPSVHNDKGFTHNFRYVNINSLISRLYRLCATFRLADLRRQCNIPKKSKIIHISILFNVIWQLGGVICEIIFIFVASFCALP